VYPTEAMRFRTFRWLIYAWMACFSALLVGPLWVTTDSVVGTIVMTGLISIVVLPLTVYALGNLSDWVEASGGRFTMNQEGLFQFELLDEKQYARDFHAPGPAD
jgi:hypothetical protein